ncbi:MAG: ATP-dependent DNA helicase RecQ [Bacteroidota bacterium]
MPRSRSTPKEPAPAVSRSALDVLQEHWGFASFRPGQTETIAAVLAGRDALAVLPTGGGKSVCYQVPAVVLGGLTLVVSPLIALMQDQVDALNRRGIPAAALTSALRFREREQLWADAEFGRYRLLYVAPEQLQTERFQQRAPRLPVRLVAVDEAHCISEWGHDFRPAYRAIAAVRALTGPVPMLAVTATATPEVRRDIATQLGLGDDGTEPHIEVRGFDRPNLLWSVHHVEDVAGKLREIAAKVSGTGLVYAGTRNGAEHWARALAASGIAAEAYHAGLDAKTRAAVQQRWLGGQTRIIAATSAFGMGIDKPDVRFVVHTALAPTLESYYQEAGRGGRDGERAHAVLLVGPGAASEAAMRANVSHPDAATVQRIHAAACSLAQVPVGSQPDGPVPLALAALAEAARVPSTSARAAVDALARADVWEAHEPRPGVGFVRMRQPAEALRRYAAETPNPALGRFVRVLLRAVHADAFTGWTDLDLRALSRRTRLSRARIDAGLRFLQEHGLLAYLGPNAGLALTFLGPRTAQAALDHAALDATRARARKRLGYVERYAHAATCRRRFLLGYFGEAAPDRCGRCDVCLGRHRPAIITPADEPILRALLDEVAVTGTLPAATRRAQALAAWLFAEGYLQATDPLGERVEVTERGQRFLTTTLSPRERGGSQEPLPSEKFGETE